MTQPSALTAYLATQNADAATKAAVEQIAAACVEIRRLVALGPIEGNLGAAGAVNIQDEEQKKLDVIANDVLLRELAACPAVAGMASEELEDVDLTGREGGVLVTFDPLDGSSNIDINVSVGTIFSVLPAPGGRAPTATDFLQKGRNQLAAGYAIYGPQAMLVLTVSDGVVAFTLDGDDAWRMTQSAMTIPAQTKEFAINMSNQRHWAPPIQAYVADLLAGAEGPRAKNFNMRWVAAMVADVHRILTRGGVFLYPWDAREPDRPGKLRLLYEGNPMSLLVERAGGKSTDSQTPILDIQPTELHQRVPIVLGSASEVDLVAELSKA